MNLRELVLPLRIYWDLTPAPHKPIPDVTSICEGIMEIKALTLDLLTAGSPLSGACIGILGRLQNEDISLVLTVSQSDLNPPATELWSRLRVDELLVEPSGDCDFRSLAEIMRRHEKRETTLGISFNVDRENCRSIPDVISFCLDNGVSRLVFPMQRLAMGGDRSYIGKEEGEALAVKLRETKTDSIELTVHDPFLWRLFYPDIAFPGAGCQAANSMTYISSDAKVYPCPSMPLELGDLKEATLKTILSSSNRQSVRRALLEPPEECLGCRELKLCAGGCRGRTFALTGSLSRRAPACG